MSDPAPLASPDPGVNRATLRAFRSTLPDCATVILSDLEAGLVLASDASFAHPQEQLDALAADTARALSCALDPGVATPHQAVLLGPTASHLVLRDPAIPSHALTCICAPDADLRSMLQAMAGFLARQGRRGTPA